MTTLDIDKQRIDPSLADEQHTRKDLIVGELTNKRLPVNYSQILGRNSIIFAAEHHSNRTIREHIGRYAQSLKNSGITHFTVEVDSTLNEKLQQLSRGGITELPKEFDLASDGYEEMIKTILDQGIEVVAIDVDYAKHPHPTRNERETEMFENVSSILRKNPQAKIFSLFGTFHTVIQFDPQNVPSVRKRFQKQKIPTTTVFFHGGEENTSGIFGRTKFGDQIISEGLDEQEFMLNNTDNTIAFDKEADWVVHLPSKKHATK